MLKNWLLITSVPFLVGFSATMLWNKNPGQSAIAGSAGVLGVATGMGLSRQQRKQELERQLQSIQVTVNTLEQQEKSLGQQLQNHQDNRQTVQHQVEQLEQQLANLQSQKQGQEASAAKFDRELETKRNSATELETATQAKRAELATLTAEMSVLQQQQAVVQTSMLNLQDIEAEIAIYSATKTQLTLEITKLEDYQSEIKIQIADDKDVCEKAEEYFQYIDQEVADKREDLLELDINIKAKSTELNQCRTQLNALSQQKNEAESALTKLAIELQKAGQAVLDQEDLQQAAELEVAKLASDISSLKLELLDCHTQMTEPSLQFVAVPSTVISVEESLPMELTDLQEVSLISADYFADLCEMELGEIDPTAIDLDDINLAQVRSNETDLNDLISVSANSDELDFDDMTLEQAGSDETELNNLISVSVNSDELDFDDMTLEQAGSDETELNDLISVSANSDELDLNGMTLEQIGLDGMDLNSIVLVDNIDLDVMDLLDMDLLDITDLDDMTLDQSNLEDNLNNVVANWSDSFAENPHLQVLQHIDQHGSIAHFEVTALLNDKKSAKLFGSKVLEYSQLLPFEIEIEPSKNGNRYIKRTGVLAAIS
jgi:myosin heavy subunit